MERALFAEFGFEPMTVGRRDETRHSTAGLDELIALRGFPQYVRQIEVVVRYLRRSV